MIEPSPPRKQNEEQAMLPVALPPAARLKLDLMFEGVRYTDALGRAAEHSFLNYSPYRFGPGEHDPTGEGRADIPYMLITEDKTHARIRGDRTSPWSVSGSRETGYDLRHDGGAGPLAIEFEPKQAWNTGLTRDGLPRQQAGVSLHGDMAVVNVAPGCDYFGAPKRDGVSMRCTFCTYGAPDARIRPVGQVMGQTAIPEATLARMQEILSAALEQTRIRHIYLVGGSLVDPHDEGRRYVQLARSVQEVNDHRVPVTCGSGALPESSMRLLHQERLVDAVSFNLEVWSERLFARICPGKHRYVGYDRWIESLEHAVRLWGRGRVYSAMVAGIEFGPELGLSPGEALEIALRGADDLCRRGILPIYSLYWYPAGRDLPEHLGDLRHYFEQLQLGYFEIRRKHGLQVWDGFMCHRCAYMQLECDIDRAAAATEMT
jgi:hypothetical protein